MEEEESLVKYNVKIGIPFYKAVYSILFVIVLALVRGITYVEEIGVAMDANIALLALVFCADGYYQEFSEGRWEVFSLCPSKRKWRTLLQRFFLQVIWILIVAMAGYFVFYWQRPGNLGDSDWLLWLQFGIVAAGSIFFFGSLSFTLVNLFHNLWAGLGISVIIWSLLNSTTGQKLPEALYVFAYGKKGVGMMGEGFNWTWILGKISAMAFGSLLLFFGKKKVKETLWTPR